MPSYANNHSLHIMAIAKAVIAGIITLAVAYCIVTNTPIEDKLLELILLIIAGYFGYSAKLYRESKRKKGEIEARLACSLPELMKGREDN